MNRKPTVLLAVKEAFFSTIFDPTEVRRLGALATVLPVAIPVRADKAFLLRHAAEAEILVTSWDTAALDREVLEQAGRLRLVCHAAGSIRPVITDAFWERPITITSSAEAIARGVAEFCLGLILSEAKRVTFQAWGTRSGRWAEPARDFGGAFEIYRQNIGVIGAGHIGRHLIRLLGSFESHVVVYDPFLPAAEAAELGVRQVDTLEDLFSSCRIVSLHAPTNESTRHMLRGAHFARLPAGSLFINTAGSIQIHEEEFVAELRKERFIACIDRCEVEPCPLDHPYRKLPNVLLTPHIAGVMAENRLRIGALVTEEVERFTQGRPPRFPVTQAALARMA